MRLHRTSLWHPGKNLAAGRNAKFSRVRAQTAGDMHIAAGHSMIGTTLATATGKLVAELVDDRPPHIDPRPFAVTRF